MTKSKNDIEGLFTKLLGSANSFNSINTFNEEVKDIFRNKSFKFEDVNHELDNVIDNINNNIGNKEEEAKDNFLNKEINRDLKESKYYEEESSNKELKKEIINSISNVVSNLESNEEDEKDFNLKNIGKSLNENKLKEAIVLTEILGKPMSKRRRNRNRGYR